MPSARCPIACGFVVERLRKNAGKPAGFCTRSTVFKKYLTAQVFLYQDLYLAFAKLSAAYKQAFLVFFNPLAGSLSALSPALTNTTKLIKEV